MVSGVSLRICIYLLCCIAHNMHAHHSVLTECTAPCCTMHAQLLLQQNGNGDVGAAVLLGKPKKIRMFAKSLREVESLRLDQRRRLMEVHMLTHCYTLHCITPACSIIEADRRRHAVFAATSFHS